MRSRGAGCRRARGALQARSIGGCCAREFLELCAAAQGYRHPSETAARGVGWDDFTAVPALAREADRRRGCTSPCSMKVAVGIRARAPRQLSQRNAWAARRLAERLTRIIRSGW